MVWCKILLMRARPKYPSLGTAIANQRKMTNKGRERVARASAALLRD
jgi:hypothetical protein